LVATLLGEAHSKIKPRVDDTLEAVVKASHIRELTLKKILALQVEGFTMG